MASGHAFLGNIEAYDTGTRTYTISPLRDRINPSNWIEGARMVRGYKSIQEKNIVGHRVLCIYQNGTAYILGIFDDEDINDSLVISFGEDAKLIAYPSGVLQLAKEIGDKKFDVVTYNAVTDTMQFNLCELRVNVLGSGSNGFMNIVPDRENGGLSYEIDMGTYMQKKTERLTFKHDKDGTVLLIDGDRELLLRHSHRDNARDLLSNIGESSVRIGRLSHSSRLEDGESILEKKVSNRQEELSIETSVPSLSRAEVQTSSLGHTKRYELDDNTIGEEEMTSTGKVIRFELDRSSGESLLSRETHRVIIEDDNGFSEDEQVPTGRVITVSEGNKDSEILLTSGGVRLIVIQGGQRTELLMDKEELLINAQRKVVVNSTEEVVITSGKITINGGQVEIKGGVLSVSGESVPGVTGPFNCLPNCLFTGAPHKGERVILTP